MTAWYKTGTIAVTNGSPNVIGTGTSWLTGVFQGDLFTVDYTHFYEVSSVTDDTHLTLVQNYGQTTASGSAYAIVPTSPSRSQVTSLVAQFASLLAQYQGVISAAGNDKLAYFNKSSLASNAGIILQDNSSYRFRVGIFGADDFEISYSPTGANTWVSLLNIEPTTGEVFGPIQNANVQTVINMTTATPPVSPTNGATYVVAASPTGAWAGKAGQVARWSTARNTWLFYTPQNAQLIYNLATSLYYSYLSGAFTPFQTSNIFSTNVGIGMTPVNVLDITQNQNASSTVQLLNNNASTAAIARYSLSNGASVAQLIMHGTGYTTSGSDIRDGARLMTTGAGGLVYEVPSSATHKWYVGTSQKMGLDANGHLGVGAAPQSGWGSSVKAIDVGSGPAIWSQNSATDFRMTTNLYHDGTNYKYSTTAAGTQFAHTNGTYEFYTVASGTAGTTATPSLLATLDLSGSITRFFAPSGKDLQLLSAGGTSLRLSNSAGWVYVTGGYNSSFTGSAVNGLDLADSVDANNAWYLLCRNSVGTVIGGVQRNATSNSMVFQTSSDERLKNWDIEQRNYRNAIQSLWVGDFDMYNDFSKTGDAHRTFGVRAQQAYEVLGGLGVSPAKTPDDVWQASAEPFGFLALWGVKDLYNEVIKLRAEIAALKQIN